jgi:aminoglycoside phosphotransferase (APT) family kinase protein
LYNDAESWIADCLARQDIDLLEAVDVSGGSGCQVWDCRTLVDDVIKRYVLKVYQPGFDDYSKLGPVRTARKYIHALEELLVFSLCMPRMAGSAFKPDQAAVLTHKVLGEPWDSDTRIEAARTLGRLHQIQLGDLSDEFGALVKESTQNTQRIFIGVEDFSSWLDQKAPTWGAERRELYRQTQALLERPESHSEMVTLVHGDYFSSNLLLENDKLHVIDWDLLALGDPMWDLGFSIGADRNLEQKEVDAVIETYSQLCPIDAETLAWHKQCWYLFWELKYAKEKE